MSIRPVKRVSLSQSILEGAGVRLHRAFGFADTPDFDPFLLLDDLRNDHPEDYLAGFPWHPHRGIETITYVLSGSVTHSDSLGNRGIVGPGDVQWMTAGRGVLHQEMPQGDHLGQMHGFQLWANLPASLKMTTPRYQDIQAQAIPCVTDDDGTCVRVICGSFWGKTGPIDGVPSQPRYLDVTVAPNTTKRLAVERPRHAFAYVFEGSGTFCDASEPQSVRTESVVGLIKPVANRSLVCFDGGDEICIRSGRSGVRFLLISGLQLNEPVAWRGPIVMNTQTELKQAFAALQQGTFIQDPK